MTLYKSIQRYEDSGVTALYFENKRISYKSLLVSIRRVAAYLKEKGIKKGDVVTVALPNLPTTVYLFYALDALGAVQNIVHPLSSTEQVLGSMTRTGSRHAILLETVWQDGKKLFEDSAHTFFFVNPMYDSSLFMRYAFYLKYKRAAESERIYHLDSYRKFRQLTEIEDRDPEETSVYLHSGGTTGEPKIIELSDRAIENLSKKVSSIVGTELRGKAMLAVLPTFHGFGLGMGIHAPLSHCAASSLMIRFNADMIIKWINQGKINMIIGVPLLYRKLMDHPDFSSSRLQKLEQCFVGGDNVPPSLIEEFNSLMKAHGSDCMMLEGYGLTETVTVCNVNTKSHNKIGSVGRALDNITVEIRDEEQNLLDTGMIGEVYISGDTLMNGYLSDPQASADVLCSFNSKLWVRTGDLGYLDSEGYLFLKGRKKRMFKISGINIYPSEIEKIATDTVDIADAALEFFEEPKPHTVLFIKRRRGSEACDEDIRARLYAAFEGRVLKYSIPTQIIFMDKFPQTRVGKIDHSKFEEKQS